MIFPGLGEKESRELLDQILKAVLDRLGPRKAGCKVLVFDEVREELLFENFGPNLEIIRAVASPVESQSIQHRILGALTCSQMADLAQGKASDQVTAKVLEALLGGHLVEVLVFEYEAFRRTASVKLFHLYEIYRQQLEEFGLRKYKKAANEEPLLKKRLITEEDVLTAEKRGVKELWLSQKALVTPLAMDCARSRRITIHRER
jgi:ethanolamine utilization protein